MATGRLIVLSVLGVSAEIEGKTYSTGPERGEGEPFIVGQASSEGDDILVDFVDPNVEDILVSLRVTWFGGEEMYKGRLFTLTTSVDVTCMEGG